MEEKQKKQYCPAGDTRFTANISIETHRKIKMLAANRGCKMGEVIEQLVESAQFV